MRIKKLWLATIAALWCSITVSAYEFEVGGIYYNIISSTDLTIEVTSNNYSNDYSGAVVIPSTVTYNGNTYSVTGIGEAAFWACSSLTSITIPSSVTSIGKHAFWTCSSLTSITIPESVTSIGEDAFYDCSSLTSITIPESVTSIGRNAFWYCCSLTSITIPESVTSIGIQTFEHCESLTSITIPKSVTSIGGRAFSGCSSLTSITIPESVTSIGSSAFYGCSSLTSITIPKSVTSIGGSAFRNCSSLTSITIPESVTSIGNYTFENCESLTSIIIPDGVTSIGEYAFAHCSSLTSITIPESVTSIGESAFAHCSSLTSITIPESVTSIGESAFYGCSSLTAVHISNLEAWYNIDFENYDANPLSYAKNLYLNGELVGKLTIPNSVTAIKKYTFYNCSSLTSITIPESVTSIGGSAFYGCSSLTAVHISNLEAWCNIDFDGSSANPLYHAKNLYLNGELVGKLTIPNTVTAIKDYAFYNCSSLTSITIPEGATNIGNDAFDGCSSLTAVYINSLEAWCNIDFGNSSANPLYHAKNLYLNGELVGKLTIPNSVTAIKKYTFYNCSSLTSITIPESVTSIGGSAFYGCSSLKTVINYSDLTLQKGSSSNGYVAYYAKEVINVVRVNGITLNRATATLTEGRSLTLTATIAPDNATDKTVTWATSDAAIATVVDGVVTAVAPGTATITAKAGGKEATCVLTVEFAPLSTREYYRVKNVTTGLYLQVSGNNTNMKLQNKAEGVELLQVFQLEEAAEGKYYLKAADSDKNYYAHASGWNFNATTNAEGKTPFTIALVEGGYTLYQGASTYTGYAGADATEEGAVIYCNKNINQNGKWIFEALTAEEQAAYHTALNATAINRLDEAIARARSIVNTRSAVLSEDEIEAIENAVAAAEAERNRATEKTVLNALTEAINAAVDAAIYVWSLDELSNEVCYAVSTEDRGAWYSQSENLNSTTKAGVAADANDSKQQFAFVKSAKGAYYLYSVSEEKFVKVGDVVADKTYTALTEAPVQTISILNGTRSDKFPWVVALNVEDGQKQLAVSNNYTPGIITFWNDLKDSGNTVRIEKVAAFDATEALAAIDAFENPVIAVSGITLNQTTASLTEGETLTLVATVLPDDATDRTVTWSTSDASVATVDENGTVTAVAEGTATITAMAGGMQATCEVTVKKMSGTTDIESSTLNSQHSVIYDLQGRRVLNTENLKGGVYIVNGKKVVMK